MQTTTTAGAASTLIANNPAIQKQELIGAGCIPHVTQFARAQFGPGQVAPAHAHPDLTETFFVESGSGTMTVNGVAIALTTGVAVCVEAGERHEIAASATSDLAILFFSVKN